ncbi:MAG: DUF362 domain-containing protein [Verrucomicrobia bacterium]|nr:DUF362 domain-containing protein [Verrucomicrobiota bacterium]
MNSRREFLKAGLALGAALSLPRWTRLAGAEPGPAGPAARPVLVAVRDGTRAAMLDRALAELGGIGLFVRPGQTVCVKPNIGWDAPPERGANTHPELVGHLVRRCLEAGAKSVSVFDNTCDQWQLTYDHSGIAAAAREAGAHVVSGKDETLYREVELPGGRSLRRAFVHSLVLDSDVLFNVPVLKHHSGAGMTAAMKNLMGAVLDRRFYHQNDLQQSIADFLTLRRPTLNILDAYHPMVRNGPRGKTTADLVEMRTLMACTDPVALDAAAAKMLGLDPEKIGHIRIGAEMKLGTMDLTQVDIRRLSLA